MNIDNNIHDLSLQAKCERMWIEEEEPWLRGMGGLASQTPGGMTREFWIPQCIANLAGKQCRVNIQTNTLECGDK